MTALDDLPRGARRALSTWIGTAVGLLGEDLSAAWLYGGAVLADFEPRWSDLDVCLALTEPLSGDRRERLSHAHRDLHERFVAGGEEGWASPQFVEGAILTIDRLEDPLGRGPGDEVGPEGITHRRETALAPFDRYQLHHFARPLLGGTVVVAPPSREDLRQSLRRQLDRLEYPRLDRPVWLAGMLHWAARSLVFWRDGAFVSKTRALEREIVAGSPHAEAFALALAMRREGPAACRANHDRLREVFSAAAPALLESLLPWA